VLYSNAWLQLRFTRWECAQSCSGGGSRVTGCDAVLKWKFQCFITVPTQQDVYLCLFCINEPLIQMVYCVAEVTYLKCLGIIGLCHYAILVVSVAPPVGWTCVGRQACRFVPKGRDLAWPYSTNARKYRPVPHGSGTAQTYLCSWFAGSTWKKGTVVFRGLLETLHVCLAFGRHDFDSTGLQCLSDSRL
jgi:hypothetical protein